MPKRDFSLKGFDGEYDLSDKHIKIKRIIAIASLIIALAIMGVITFACIDFFNRFSDTAEFRAFVEGYGFWGWFVVLGLQILQVVVAFIPGEVVELGSGFVFGTFKGTVLCLVGVTIGSVLIFLLTKKLGLRITALFVSPKKLQNYKFLADENKLSILVFILFMIPGTPKDLLTYIVGLTKMKLSEFLIISLIARLPSVVSSTWGGSAVGDGNYLKAIIIFAVTAVVSLIGLKIYSVIIKKRNIKKGRAENGAEIEK